MTWTITTTTTISASRAVTLAERIPSEPIKFVVLHPGTGAGGTVTIWDDLGRSVASTRIDSLSPRHEAEFFSDRSIFNVSAAIDGNATLSGAGVSVYLVSREAPEPSIADGSTSFAGPVRVEGDLEADGASFGGPARFGDTLVADKPIVAPWVTTKLDRLLRIATFGDSTASSIGIGGDVGAGANCDQERMYTPFPGSGSTEYKTWQATATAYYWIPSLIVATGGIIGQQVQQMLDRSKAAYSATRKSLEDVDAKRPDAILFHGASINDYLGMTASTPQATIDAAVDKHRRMVEFYTSRRRHVVDSGCYGYSVAGPNLAAVCAIIVQTNAALKQLAKNNPYWHFIDTAGITHDGTGLYIPSCTSDGTHLSPTGGFRIGKAEAEILDRLFISGESGDVIWDQSVDFANAVANQPANLDLDLGGSSLTVVSKSVEPSKYTVVVDAQAGGNLKTWVKNLSAAGGALYNVAAGDALTCEVWVEVFDANGLPYIGCGAGMRINILDAANALGVYYDRYNGAQTNRPFVRQFSSPINGANAGSNSQLFHGVDFPDAGRYTVVFHPLRIRKYTPWNTLP